MSSGGATWGAELRMRVYRALERHLSAGVRTGHRSLQDQAPGRGLDVGHSKTEHRGEDWTRVTPRLSAVVRTGRRSLQDRAPGRGLDESHSKRGPLRCSWMAAKRGRMRLEAPPGASG